MGFLKRHLATALPAFGSAALIWAAFPPLDCGFLAWVALTPWLVMAGRSASRRAWLWSLLAGYALFVALLHWLRFVGPEGWVTLALYCALYWPAATLLLRRLKRRGLPFALTAPVTFAAFEFIRGNFLTGFPFFFLAHTQYRCLPIVQIADITGVYGITFLIALVNGCLADLILECGARAKPCGGAEPSQGSRDVRSKQPALDLWFTARSRRRSWRRARLRLEPDARAPAGAGAEGGARPGERAAEPQGYAVARGRGQIPAAPRRALQGGGRPARGAGDLAGDDLSARR